MKTTSESFCVLPWIHLATHPHGGVSLCCRVDYTDGIGMAFNQVSQNKKFLNLNQSSVSEIINADSFKSARLDMLRGQWPKACLGCKKDEISGIKSKRQRENEYFSFTQENASKITTDVGLIQPNFEYLELRLGNLCNLKCRTCNPYSSSKWTEEYEKVESQLEFVRKYDRQAIFKWPDDQEFWENAFQSSTNLKLLFINGGEPTLINQHWTYLERLVLSGRSQNIDIKYNINMTFLPPKAKEIWKSFKSVFVGASIDDINQRNSYIRHGADWNLIEENLLKIKSWNIPIAIEQTVSAMNVYYLDEVEKYSKKIGVGYGLNFVYDPPFLAVDIIPEKLKPLILKKLNKNGYSSQWYKHVEAHFKTESKLILWRQFFEYTKKLDMLRNESFEAIFPDYAEIIQFDADISNVV